MANTPRRHRALILSRAHQLLHEIHSRFCSDCHPTNRPPPERSDMGLECRLPVSIQLGAPLNHLRTSPLPPQLFPSLPFEVHTDASDYVIGRVLMQAGHSVVFKSQKLSDTEQRYSVHEKEMIVVVHCLRTWHHYLLGTHFTIFTTQKKLTSK